MQYRVLNRALTTNLYRHNWDKSISKLCTFCNDRIETLEHLLYQCYLILPLWKNLAKILNYFYQLQITINIRTALLNDYDGKNKEILNLLIVILKQHIYSEKCFQRILHFQDFMGKLSYWYLIDKCIAFEQNKVKNFYPK